MLQTNLKSYAWLSLLLAIGGCATDEASVATAGNDSLGIARFVVDDSANRTVVHGLDAAGNEIGRVDLFHGRFTLSDMFAEGYVDRAVDGRKLDVYLGGEHKLAWETPGYEPLLRLPAHPKGAERVAAFLADAHVKPVLDRWQIGFLQNATNATGEEAYTTVTSLGTSPVSCPSGSGQNCGTVNGLTMNLCNSGETYVAGRITVRPSYYGWAYDIHQCCGPKANVFDGHTPWFAVKSCAWVGNDNSCGTQGSGACAACPAYPVNGYSCNTGAVYLGYSIYGYYGTQPAYNQVSSFADGVVGEHSCGDGTCDPDECSYGNCLGDQTLCPSDCGGPV